MLKKFKLSLETLARDELDEEPRRSAFSRELTMPPSTKNDQVELAFALMDAIQATTEFRLMGFAAELVELARQRTEGVDDLSAEETALANSADALLRTQPPYIPTSLE